MIIVGNLYESDHNGGLVYSIKGCCPTITVSHGIKCGLKILVKNEIFHNTKMWR